GPAVWLTARGRGRGPRRGQLPCAATTGLTEVSVRTGTPVGFGLLTCDTEQQGLDRAGLEGSREDKGYEAAHAALSTALTLAAHGS
ncbi:6,7-dimethyl-8-ribityllumazine synthase, partial [Kocuria rhizophila]|uniref:6,7-dimethyl-8-ribityllumazine synthase n=1 Tax=Kocuria rhizophila TaxID=72000 RepID=UPI001F409B7B